MGASNPITAAVFSAFIKCPTKAYFLATGNPAPGTFFGDVEARINSMYKSAAKRQLRVGGAVSEPVDFGPLRRSVDFDPTTHYVDCETVVYDFALLSSSSAARHPSESTRSRSFVPVLFLPWEKPNLADSLSVCFGALALSQSTGLLADIGTLIYGDGHRHRAVSIEEHIARTRQTIEAIGETCYSQNPPPLVLNRHCAICDFQPRCRSLAIERDDLSLLTAMNVKDRAKCNAKGIFTIAQLSYGYRPRRRKRTRPDAERSTESSERVAPIVRNDHKLKALANKKRQIHVVGVPSLKFEGIQTFLDVEGMPDRDFYYLIGLRFERDGKQVERSFWADGFDGEREIWENCLRSLR